jgi:hypothetical protein
LRLKPATISAVEFEDAMPWSRGYTRPLSERETYQQREDGNKDFLSSIELSPDGKTLAIGTGNECLRRWPSPGSA